MAAETLMLFTKTFPYGKGEQYLADELPYLAETFRKIIIVPCSIFGEEEGPSKILPAHAEVFFINRAIKRPGLMDRIRNAREQKIIQREGKAQAYRTNYSQQDLPRDLAILKQQQACASALMQFMLDRRIDPARTAFYSYWLYNSCIILGLLKMRGWKIITVSRAHAYDLYHADFLPGKEKSPLPWEYFKFKSTDIIYAISDDGLEYLQKKFPEFKTRFRVARLGVRSEPVSNPENPDTVFRMVTCSTIQPRKRLYLLPDIIALLDFEVEWIHFGPGPDEDVKEITSRWKHDAKHRMELRGFVANEDVKKYYRENHVDLILNVSTAEGIPVALMEAAAFGIPLMATDVNGNREIAGNGAGILLSAGCSAEEAAEEIRKFKSDVTEVLRLRRASKEKQLSEYDSAKNYTNFAHALLENNG